LVSIRRFLVSSLATPVVVVSTGKGTEQVVDGLELFGVLEEAIRFQQEKTGNLFSNKHLFDKTAHIVH